MNTMYKEVYGSRKREQHPLERREARYGFLAEGH